MKLHSVKFLVVTVTISLGIAVAVSTIQTESVWAKDLYASGISGGKTKPLIDIDNKLLRPARKKLEDSYRPRPVKTVKRDSTREVETTNKYHLFIQPDYPRPARLANKEAIVELELTFSPEGKMKDALVRYCSTPGWGFEQAALAASLESHLSGHGEREITVITKVKFKIE